ncbi:MAG TPA: hypothetical protein VHY09_12000 [Candidatus Methylacidiphilales bacterium]|jgi:hypothetical protein|nr:hypothetical protein [Candidatus Methylacidiphilales bacterium]
MPGFHDLDAITRIAIKLLHSWGYNYRLENQLRADAEMIRAKVGLLLGTARKSVERAEADYRREFLPPPSREKPRHDPASVAGAQTLERLSKAIGSVSAVINAQPLPEEGRASKRRRPEAPTLQHLIDSDQMLVGQTDLLRSMIDGKNGAWLIENHPDLQEGLNAISETLRQRQGLLFPA